MQISEFCYKKGESKCRNRDFVWRNFSHSCKGGQTPRTKKVFETICCWVLSPRALFLLKTNKRTVPALTCPYSYRHRMMTIFFFASGMARVPVHLHAGAFGIFGERCVTRVLFSKNVFVPETCFFRFAVTDYMCLIQDAFPGIFF